MIQVGQVLSQPLLSAGNDRKRPGSDSATEGQLVGTETVSAVSSGTRTVPEPQRALGVKNHPWN